MMLWPGSSSTPVVNGAAALTIVALVIVGLYGGRDLLIPLVLAGLLSFILFPLVRRLINWKVPQGVAVTLVVTVLIAVVLGGVTFAGHQVATAGGSAAARNEATRKGAPRAF